MPSQSLAVPDGSPPEASGSGGPLAHDLMARFSAHLRAQSLKLTRERQQVLEAAIRVRNHFNAETLYLRLRSDGVPISQATVYRCLELLVECGVAVQSCLGGDQAVYEVFNPEHPGHGHLVCLRCGRVEEFSSPALLSAIQSASASAGFRSLRQCIQVFGQCRACAQPLPGE